MAIERRLTELAGPVGRQAAHGALAQRPGRHGPRDVHARARGRGARGDRGADARAAAARRAARSTGRCPATRTCSAPSRSTSAITCSPTSGCSRATARASPTRSTSRRHGCRSGRVRWRASTSTPTAAPWRAELGFAAVAPNSIDAVSGRRLHPRLPRRGRDLRDASLAARRGARAVVQRGVRLLRAARRVERRAPRSCPRRRTPTPPSCCARRRRGWWAHLAAFHGVLHALPLTYNKDLQEDKEHLFDAVDTLELSLAAATRDDRGRGLPARAHARGRDGRADRGHRAWRTCWCAWACRSARRTGWWRAWCAASLESGSSLSRAHPRAALAPTASCSRRTRASCARCSRSARGSSPRSPRAAPPARAWPSSWTLAHGGAR